MSEFNNRIKAQRIVLKEINGSSFFEEPLLSLTEKAIERWSRVNNISSDNEIAVLLKHLSSTLFFLANKSQEQITEDYKSLSKKVDGLIFDLQFHINERGSSK